MNKNKKHLYAAYKRPTLEIGIHTKLRDRKDIPCKHENKAGIAILISDKRDSKTKIVIKDKKGHSIMIEGPIQHKDL